MGRGTVRLTLIGLTIMFAAVTAQAAPLREGIAAYKPYLIERIALAIAGAKDLQRAVEAGDVTAAQAAWVKSRKGWEAVRPVTASYFADLDELIDAGPDSKTGYPAIEAVLFFANKTEGLDKPIAALLANLEQFEKRVHRPRFTITSQKLLEDTANLAAEVGKKKAALDMQENVDGLAFAWTTVFADPLKEKDAELAATIDRRMQALKQAVADAAGLDADKVRDAGDELAASMLAAAPKLDLKPFEVGGDDDEEEEAR